MKKTRKVLSLLLALSFVVSLFTGLTVTTNAEELHGDYLSFHAIDSEGTMSNGATIEAVTNQGCGSLTYDATTDSYNLVSQAWVKNARALITPQATIPKNKYKYGKVLAKYDRTNSVGYTINMYGGSNWENNLAPTQYVSASDSTNWKESVFQFGDNTVDVTRIYYFFVWNQAEPATSNVSVMSTLNYLALFENEADAIAYDNSIKEFTFEGSKGTIDPINHTIELTLPLGCTSESIRGKEPIITLASGASKNFVVPAEYGTDPIPVSITSPAGRAVVYNLKLEFTPIPQATIEEMINTLNSGDSAQIETCFTTNNAICDMLFTGFGDLTETQKDMLYSVLSDGEYTAEDYISLVNKSIYWVKLKTLTTDKVTNGISLIEENDEDFYADATFVIFRDELTPAQQESIFDIALSKSTYEEFKQAIIDETQDIYQEDDIPEEEDDYLSFHAIDTEGTMSNGATIEAVTTQGCDSVTYDATTDSYNLVSKAWVKNARAAIIPQTAIPQNKYRYAKVLAKYNNTSNVGYTVDTYAGSKWEDKLAPTQYVSASNSANWKESVFQLGENTAEITKIFYFFVSNQAEPANSTVSVTNTLNYLALFENEADAIAYDNSIKEFTFEGSKGTIDNINHTIELTLPLGCTQESIRGKAPTITLANGASSNFVVPTDYGTDPIPVPITSPAGREVVYNLKLEFTPIPQGTIDEIINTLNGGDPAQIETCFTNNSDICDMIFSGIEDLTETQKEILFSDLSVGGYNADNYISLVNKGIYWVKLKTLTTDKVTSGISLIEENDREFYEDVTFAVFMDKLSASQQESIFDIALSKSTYEEFKQTIIDETKNNYKGKYYEIKPVDDNGALSNGAIISAVTTQGAKSVSYEEETDSYVSMSNGYVKNARTEIELASSIPKNTYKYAKILAKYDNESNIGYTINTYAGSAWEDKLASAQYVSASESKNWKESIFQLGDNTADITKIFYFYVWNQNEQANENVEAVNHLQYLVLFEQEEDAIAYDDSIKSFDFNGKIGAIDNIKHTVKVELSIGETADAIKGTKPEIDIKSGGLVDFVVPENYGDDPIKFMVINPAGREVEYTLNLVYNPIPDELLQNILTSFNSKNKDAIKECFEQKDAEFKEILKSSDNAFQNLDESQKDVLYTTLSKYDETYDEHNFVALIKKAMFWTKLKTETVSKVDDGIERIKVEDEAFYTSDIFTMFNTYLANDIKTSIYDSALSKDTYEELKTEITEKTKEKTIFTQESGQKLEEVFEKYIENGYLPTAFSKEDYQKECDKVKTFDISIVFTDMNERIAKAGNTIELSDIVDIFKTSVKENVDAFSKKQNSNQSLTGGGSAGGKGIASSVSNVVSTTPVSSFIFKDCDKYEWAKESIKNLYAKGVVSGINDNEFAPQNDVTREQFVKLIVSAFGLDDIVNDINFNDVDSNAWYYNYICSAVSAGIISGMTENSFGVGRNISREDMAVICLRAMKLKKEDIKNEGVNMLLDRGDVADYAEEAVSILYQNGIISGDENGMFNPKASANRAQAAVIIDRLMKFCAN